MAAVTTVDETTSQSPSALHSSLTHMVPKNYADLFSPRVQIKHEKRLERNYSSGNNNACRPVGLVIRG